MMNWKQLIAQKINGMALISPWLIKLDYGGVMRCKELLKCLAVKFRKVLI
jgi:hypothetical protein